MVSREGLHNDCMLNVHAIKAKDIRALNPVDLAELATQMLAHIGEQSKHIGEQRRQIDCMRLGEAS